MTERWVSSAKHYCEVCKCWLSGHSRNIRAHESSEGHVANQARVLREMSMKDREKQKLQADVQRELQRIEIAAEEAVYGKTKKRSDYIAAGLEAKGANSVVLPPAPPLPGELPPEQMDRERVIERQMRMRGRRKGDVLSLEEAGEAEASAKRRTAEGDWTTFMDPQTGVTMRVNPSTGQTEWDADSGPRVPQAPPFLPSSTFQGRMPGYYFGSGDSGQGYYRDAAQAVPAAGAAPGRKSAPRPPIFPGGAVAPASSTLADPLARMAGASWGAGVPSEVVEDEESPPSPPAAVQSKVVPLDEALEIGDASPKEVAAPGAWEVVAAPGAWEVVPESESVFGSCVAPERKEPIDGGRREGREPRPSGALQAHLADQRFELQAEPVVSSEDLRERVKPFAEKKSLTSGSGVFRRRGAPQQPKEGPPS